MRFVETRVLGAGASDFKVPYLSEAFSIAGDLHPTKNGKNKVDWEPFQGIQRAFWNVKI